MFGQDLGVVGKRRHWEWNFFKWEEAVKLPILSAPRAFSFSCFAIFIAAPSGKLDMWREITPVLRGQNVTLFWKVRHPTKIETKPFRKGLEMAHMICVQLIAIQYENVFYESKPDGI